MADSTRGPSTEATVAKATEQPDGCHGTGVTNLAPGEWCGLATHTALAESIPCWVGALQKQLKWVQVLLCQKTALDKRHLLTQNVM